MRRLFMLTIATLLPLVATAAVDMYLQITNAKGQARVIRCSDGACVIEHLAPGSYFVLLCDAQGKVIPTDTTLDYTAVSPRDLATGQSSGRRMHKPITLTSSSRVAGQPAASPGNEVAIDEPGVLLVIGLTAGAVDAAAAKVTKTRSNIQNN
jgi:hypothetical protein